MRCEIYLGKYAPFSITSRPLIPLHVERQMRSVFCRRRTKSRCEIAQRACQRTSSRETFHISSDLLKNEDQVCQREWELAQLKIRDLAWGIRKTRGPSYEYKFGSSERRQTSDLQTIRWYPIDRRWHFPRLELLSDQPRRLSSFRRARALRELVFRDPRARRWRAKLRHFADPVTAAPEPGNWPKSLYLVESSTASWRKSIRRANEAIGVIEPLTAFSRPTPGCSSD